MISGYYDNNELLEMGFISVGKNVSVSKKASIYNCEKIVIGDNVRIDDFCVLSGRISFGSHIHIANFCLLAGGDEGITMDDFSGLAYGCYVFTRSDDYSGQTLTNPQIPEKYRNKTIKDPIKIGKHSICGTNTIILPGANIAEGTSTGAFTLVTKPTEPWGIYSGIPAKRIKDRKTELLLQEEQFLEEYRD